LITTILIFNVWCIILKIANACFRGKKKMRKNNDTEKKKEVVNKKIKVDLYGQASILQNILLEYDIEVQKKILLKVLSQYYNSLLKEIWLGKVLNLPNLATFSLVYRKSRKGFNYRNNKEFNSREGYYKVARARGKSHTFVDDIEVILKRKGLL